jgi:hypothetical protein
MIRKNEPCFAGFRLQVYPTRQSNSAFPQMPLWVRAASQSVTVFRSEKPCVYLLPILEVDLDDVRRLLERGLQEKNLSREFVRVFPFECMSLSRV